MRNFYETKHEPCFFFLKSFGEDKKGNKRLCDYGFLFTFTPINRLGRASEEPCVA